MRKHIASVFLVLAVLLLSGCGRLSPEEYRAELMSRWKTYLSAQQTIVYDMIALDENGTLDPDFDGHCKAFERAMDSFGKIKPPNGMDYQHDHLLEALDNEREWLAAVRDRINAKTAEEIDDAEQRITAAAHYENSFPWLFMEIISELPPDIELLRREGVLI